MGRLDIPAYLYHDTWIVTLLSPLIKNKKETEHQYMVKLYITHHSKKPVVTLFKAAEGKDKVKKKLQQKIDSGQM